MTSAPAAPAAAPGDDQAAAVVNGEPVLRSDLVQALLTIHGDEILRQLINQRLLEQEVRRRGDEVLAGFEEELETRVNRQVDARLREVARLRGHRTVGDLERELERSEAGGYAKLLEHFRAQARLTTRPRLLAERLLRGQVEVSEEQLRARYDLRFGPKALVRQIVLDTQEKAEAALNELRNGADFGRLAMERSIDSVSRERGGVMEPLPDSGALGRAAFALDEGQVSGIVKTDEGYHILKLERKVPASRRTFEEAKERLREELVAEEIERRIPDLLVELRARSTIQVTY